MSRLMYRACPFQGQVEVVVLGRKYSRFRLVSGKYKCPSTSMVSLLSAMIFPFQIARAICIRSHPNRTHQRGRVAGQPLRHYQTLLRVTSRKAERVSEMRLLGGFDRFDVDTLVRGVFAGANSYLVT